MSILTPNNYQNSNIIKFDIDYNQNKKNTILSANTTKSKLNHSQTFDNLFRKETNWPKDINDYDYKKKHLEWGKNPPANYVTKLYISSAERIFNPITQKYNDKKLEEELNKKEKKDLIENIAKVYDNELKNIQVYNIINLEDKLKGLENNKEYPKVILQKRKKFFDIPSKNNYNIISSLNFKIHHYNKPEKRPNNDLKDKDNIIDFYGNGGKQRQRIIITRTLKDFNIITNNYKNYNKEKSETDLKKQNLENIKNFYKFHKQNPITGKFYDEAKEKKYQEQSDIIKKKLLNTKKEGLYNPFNCIVYEEESLKLKEQMQENKKIRFKIRNEIEYQYRKKDLEKKDRYNNLLKNKLYYDRFKEIEKRRFDIINNKEILELNKYDKVRNKKTSWEKIKENCNENESISKKKLTISRDKDDIDKKYIESKIKRIEQIKKLPRIQSDPHFHIKDYKRKINISNSNSKRICKENSFNMEKNEWFNKNSINNNVN